MIVKIITFIIFLISLIKTIQLITIFFNKERVLTERGHIQLGICATLLIISALQIFGIFDFISFIIK